ncbi:hypothetical protein CJ030_MR3G012312 [Morella rubra]|uniref:RNase H type-1 domain-containing protein n=1 Tax=Morella rubra TaxID=262757 RepID=A0A6A1W5B3_9ROSI|nr:hypothetical protein CJ030_MR3G012312 [Morella rubra]
MVESDSLTLGNEVNNSPDHTIWIIAEQVEAIEDLLKRFPDWQIRWIPRKANRMAHLLAKWAASSGEEGVIPLDTTPVFVKFCDL